MSKSNCNFILKFCFECFVILLPMQMKKMISLPTATKKDSYLKNDLKTVFNQKIIFLKTIFLSYKTTNLNPKLQF